MTSLSTDTDSLSRLNPAQREAVLHFEGPMLVLAGAGSGKTRVLTTRIARLIEHHGVDPRRILALTFTNKAAGEMRERIARLLGQEPAGMWIGTFHSVGARMLRRDAPLVGRTHAFTIYDEDESLSAIKRVMERLKISTKEWSPRAIAAAISDAKNALVPPAEYASLAMDPLSMAVAKVYPEFESALRDCNAVGFDDLLLLPVRVLQQHADRLAQYRERFQFILVDEYQDTNRAQYQLIKLLGGEHGNVFVVGDDDQCLAGGTLVTMVDGSKRPIEQVAKGDLVRSGYGSGRFGPARVSRATVREGRSEGVAITTRAGRRLVSTPEHTHFAGYRLGLTPQTYFTYLMWRNGVGYRRNVVVTLCGDGRGNRPLHRISMVGNDPDGRQALQSLGLSVRTAKSASRSWRHETASVSYESLRTTVDQIRTRFPVNVCQAARLGRNRAEDAPESNSLPFLPAASVMPGMAMFDEHGEYDVVATVERVPLDGPVYDIDVDDTHNFVAEGLVTHNSIYGWRGADVRNILDFEKDFPAARIVRLEENYRSTPQVLDLANVVISENTGRRGKTLRATRGGGERVTVVDCLDDRDEADWVSEEIVARQRAHRELTLRHIVLLYRTNSQSRVLEEALRRRAIPYRLVGAVRFYDRREIRDLLAYLRLIANPADDEAFLRAVGVPRRGIGDTTLAQLADRARAARQPLLETAAGGELPGGARPAVRQALTEFGRLLGEFRQRAMTASVDELLRELIERIGYAEHLRAEGPEGAERLENVRELITSAAETVIDEGGEVGLTPLDHFLQRVSLVAGIDAHDSDAEAVTLMTLHTAKGLEFPFVFITGLEEGLFPLSRAHDGPAQLEEERRLFYVGITRAERKLYLTHARSRRRNGETLPSIPSSFLRPIPPGMLEEHRTIKLRSSGRSTSFASPAARRPGSTVSMGRVADVDIDASQDAPRYVKGERVRHVRFGAGTIAEVSGIAKDVKVTIDFDDESIGRKQIKVAYTNLERAWE